MKEMLPEGAVRQKMTVEGFSASAIDDFLAGRVARLPMPSAGGDSSSSGGGGGGLGGLNFSEVKLSAPSREAPPPPAAPKMSLLEEIQKGSKLKTVTIEDTKATKTQATGGLLGMLAMEMSKRRINMNVNESESDSDSGFSSSSDSEDD
jgi:hypothetical protein